MGNPVGWFEIYVGDMARAKTFYEALLGVKLERLNTPVPELEMWAFAADMTSYGCGGALVKMDGFPAGVGGTLIYFSCEDCGVTETRVVPAGGTVVKSKMSIGEYGFISIVSDTEGNVIGLHSRV